LAFAEPNLKLSDAQPFFCFKIQILIWTSVIYSAPFHRSNLKWDVLFLAGTGVLIATDRHASSALPGNHVDISRNISSAGLYGTSAAAGVLWLYGLATHSEHAREAGTLSAEAFANAVPVYVGLQLLTDRERPNEGSGNGRFWHNNALNSSLSFRPRAIHVVDGKRNRPRIPSAVGEMAGLRHSHSSFGDPLHRPGTFSVRCGGRKCAWLSDRPAYFPSAL
jgi:hypothetical protein